MMTTEEKRQLGQSLSQLSPEDLSKAIQIIAQKNPDFKATEQEVEVDIDAQVESSNTWSSWSNFYLSFVGKRNLIGRLLI
jgi:hypothetical protein